MIRWERVALLLSITALLLVIAPAAQAAQPQPLNHQDVHANLMLPVKISFNISPNPSYFWSAMLSENGQLSWDGLPNTIKIYVDIGGPVYNIFSFTSLPFTINTGDVKFPAGSDVWVVVKVISEKGNTVATKNYIFPVTNSVFNITLLGPAQPLVYKPVFNP